MHSGGKIESCAAGDLIFQLSFEVKGSRRVIRDATDSNIVHVGICDGEGHVIQARKVVERTALDKYLNQSSVNIFKRFKGIDSNTAQKLVGAAKAYLGRDYDPEYRDDDDNALYCSELVMRAALAVGIDVRLDAQIQTSWLDTTDRSVKKFLRGLGIKSPSQIPSSWRITPPHMLFHSDFLEGVEGIGDRVYATTTKRPNALYVHISGDTPDEKLAYIKEKWSSHLNDIEVRTEMKDDALSKRQYKLILKNKQNSITLFANDPDELKLIRMIDELLLGAATR